MGALCSKSINGGPSGEKDMMKEVEKLLRISPFGRRKRLVDAKWGGAVGGQGGLLDRCIEVVCDTIEMQGERGLECLPDDLIQLIVDRLIETERLNAQTALLLRGGTFYTLNVDGYPMDAGGCGAWWLDNMFPVTLETVILSRTPVDDYFVANLPEMPRLKTLHLDCCERITDGSLRMLSGICLSGYILFVDTFLLILFNTILYTIQSYILNNYSLGQCRNANAGGFEPDEL